MNTLEERNQRKRRVLALGLTLLLHVLAVAALLALSGPDSSEQDDIMQDTVTGIQP